MTTSTTSTLARAIATTMTGTVLSAAGISPVTAGTVNYNAFNQGVAAPWQLVSGGNGTDGWMRTAANACGAAGNTCGAGPATSNNPAKVVAAGNVAVPWAGTDPRNDPKFNYAGTQTLNWSATIGAGESVTVSKTDSITRYGNAALSNGQTFQWADIDTAKGAWHDNSETGWAHDTDIGIFKSEVTQQVTLTISTLLAGGGTNDTPDYGITVFEGISTLTGNYNHHKAWHTMAPAAATAVGQPGAPGYSPVSGLRINDEGTPAPGMFPGSGVVTGTGPFANFVLDDVVGNSATFEAKAGVAYTIYVGGFRAGDWTETRNLYQLVIAGAAAPAKPKLTIGKIGTGTGKVTSSPAGIDCGTICSASFNTGQQVTLTGAPDSGSQMNSWSGCTTNSGTTCSVTMPSTDKTVTANFATATPAQVALTVNRSGNGTITSAPAGINCGSDCTESYTTGTSVTLTAAPASGNQFSGWGGACSGTAATCTVSMTAAKSVTATFAVIPPSGQFALTVTNGGNGKITSSPAGIDCGTTCSAPFNSGTQVTLTAAPDSGYQFTGWSGACSGTATCAVTVDAAKNVTANFASTSPGQFALTVTNGGNGKVTSSPGGIDCGATCSASFDSGTAVALTATPDQGYQFAGWSGACSGTDACNVTMSEARSVTASFAAAGPGPYALTLEKRGSGSVTSSPAGIDCGGTCSASFDSGTLVTLTATPNTGWQFAGWSGACDGATTCTVNMDTARTITAAFIQPPLRDFDGDGRADLFWRQGQTGRNSLWLMLGRALKASSSVSSKGKAWSIAAVADFDGDNRADVLWRRNRTGQNQLWLMDAERVKSIVVLPDQAATYTAARTGDFDRDGKMDIIWASPSTGEVSLWLMNGPSLSSAVALPAALPGYALAEVGDFNGDNQPDVWWFNASTGGNSVWLMTGSTVQATATPPSQSSDWMLVGAGLFNHDVKADVLWRNRTTGANQIWLMDGATQTGVADLPSLARSWAVAGVDDFNHDGQPDIFWRKRGSNQNRMWLMNGTEPSRRAQVTALSKGWATPSH